MASWLKLIGSAKAPLVNAPFHGVYTTEEVGFRKAQMPGIRTGDHLFLYAAGGSRRVFALAEATKDPERNPNYDANQEGSCQWRIPVHYLVNLPVSSGILIDDINSSHRDLTQSLRQASHIALRPEESDTAQRRLEAARLAAGGRDPVGDSVLPEEVVRPSGLVEGALRSITVNAYERNPQARRQCIEAHGTTCCICGFSFGAMYGELADGYIHVHHLRPLSEVNGEYVVDPIKDLRPVCPNCHAVLHLGGECRTIDEVKRMLETEGLT
jgi:hypothetical protein